ncbi:MAG: hypothetical protein ABI729_10305, partial [Chitinophagales bacterium]
EGATLKFTPCLPPDWEVVKVNYRYEETLYVIQFLQDQNQNEKIIISEDGVELKSNSISLVNDEKKHEVSVTTGREISQ